MNTLIAALKSPSPSLEEIQALLDEGSSPDADSRGSDGPLHLALRLSRQSAQRHPIALALLEAGADPLQAGEGGALPLELALRERDPSLAVIEELLARGAQAGKPFPGGAEAPLHLALRLPETAWQKEGIVLTLLSNGAEPDARGAGSALPLQLALTQPDPSLRVIEALLENGADASLSPRGSADSLLHLALRLPSGHPKKTRIVAALLDHGAEVDLRGANAELPLQVALSEPAPSLALIQTLIERGPDLGLQPGGSADSLLHLALRLPASCNEKREIVEALLGQGADLDARGANAELPLQVALSEPEPSLALVQALIYYGPYLDLQAGGSADSLLHLALRLPSSCKDKAGIVEALLSQGADANARGAGGEIPLQLALSEPAPSLALIEALLYRGPDVELQAGGSADLPLHLALRLPSSCPDKAEIVEALLAQGADANARGGGGEIPLQVALSDPQPSLAIVESLLSHGADLDQPLGRSGSSFLSLALGIPSSSKERVHIVKALIRAGADEGLCPGDWEMFVPAPSPAPSASPELDLAQFRGQKPEAEPDGLPYPDAEPAQSGALPIRVKPRRPAVGG